MEMLEPPPPLSSFTRINAWKSAVPDLNINRLWRNAWRKKVGRLIPEWAERIKRGEKSGERSWYKWMRLRNGKSKRWKTLAGPVTARISKQVGRGKTVHSQAPPCLHFLSMCSLQRMHYTSHCFGSIIRSRLYREGPLRQTLVPWNIPWCNALWLIVLRPISKAFVTSLRRIQRELAISAAVKGKIDRRPIFLLSPTLLLVLLY